MPNTPKLCPGQSTLFWRPEDIYELPCPACGKDVEFFKTDIRRTCRGCGTKMLNPRVNLSCAEWCSVARDCLGPDLYAQAQEKKDLEKRRESDLKALLDRVDPGDAGVRALFERLFRENRYEDRLIDTDRLFLVKEEDEALFKRAIACYSGFVSLMRKQGSEGGSEKP